MGASVNHPLSPHRLQIRIGQDAWFFYDAGGDGFLHQDLLPSLCPEPITHRGDSLTRKLAAFLLFTFLKANLGFGHRLRRPLFTCVSSLARPSQPAHPETEQAFEKRQKTALCCLLSCECPQNILGCLSAEQKGTAGLKVCLFNWNPFCVHFITRSVFFWLTKHLF